MQTEKLFESTVLCILNARLQFIKRVKLCDTKCSIKSLYK